MRVVLAASLVIALGGCASRTYVRDNTVTRVESLSGQYVPDGVELFETGVPYRIGPLDKLRYDVIGLDNMSGEVVVDSGGRMSLPLVGSMVVAGHTPAEVEAEAVAALQRQYIRNPVVSINAIEINSQTITVDGSVREPGIYPVLHDMTLIRAIASAKGLADFARQTNVMVFRSVQGRRYAALYNLEAIRRGAYSDPRLYAGDIVVIDESRSKRLFRDLLQTTPALLSPLVILLTRP